jgi:FkbM family methyltransferase
MTATAPAKKTISSREIAQFICSVARPKPQDDNAANAYAMALALDPQSAEAWNGIGRVEMGRGNYDEGIECFTKAIRIAPDFAEARIHRGVANDRLGNQELALMDLRKAVAIDPSITLADLLVYGILENQERYQEAYDALAAGLEKRPDDTDLLFCRATLDLGARNYEQGWKGYESRPTKLQLTQMLDEYPEWDGSPIESKRLLVCREQGLGDEIMFARFVAEAATRCGHLILYCYPPLARLFANIPGVAEVVTTDRDVPEFDCWVAMGSLPLKLGAELKAETYLSVENPEPKTAAFKVGLCWKGNPAHARDAYRSIPFKVLSPLLAVEGIEFVSLQQNDTESDLDKVGDRCHDFYDLAQAMMGLDLVITVDTSVAHLAGALGVPTWVLLGKPSDWRWNTPLYKSVIPFENDAPKDWTELIYRTRIALTGAIVDWQTSPKPTIPISRTCMWRFPQPEASAYFENGYGAPLDGESFTTDDLTAADCKARFAGIPNPGITTTDTRHGKLQYFTSDLWLGRSLALYGEWSEGECELYRRVIGPNDYVMEVGANIGAHTVELAKLAHYVIALEANPPTCEVLKQNLLANAPDNVEALCVAAGDKPRRASLLVKANNPGGTEVQEDESGDIAVETLDFILGNRVPVHFLKLDCEGSELAVLQGAVQTIERCRPLLYVENDRADKSDALITWIHQRNYRLYQHHTPLFNANNHRGYKINVFGNLVSAMLFCVPAERFDLRPTEWGMERLKIVRK